MNNIKYYLAYIAACIIVVNIILIKINYKKISNFFKSKLNFKQLLFIFFTNASLIILIYILFPFIWPLLLVSTVKEKLNKNKIAAEEEKSKFHIEFKDLIQKFDLKEIESKEIVHDPLEAVPPLPFGHLHKAWLTYCEQIEAEDELWSFSAAWTTRWDLKEQIEGYVAVRKGAIGPYFRTH